MAISVAFGYDCGHEQEGVEVDMYGDLSEWWPLISAPEEYAGEASVFRDILLQHEPAPRTVLELGSGGGNNASHLKAGFEMTLTDLSDEMLTVSRKLNPECAHAQGDMRTLRLGTTFDAIFVHDAICYMTTEADLKAVFETAHVHCKDGGVALFAPDWVRETFAPGTDDGGFDDPSGAAVRYLEWAYDPDPSDTIYNIEYVLVLKDARHEVRVVHDRHVEGIFPTETWLWLLREVGFEPEAVQDPIEPGRILFVARK